MQTTRDSDSDSSAAESDIPELRQQHVVPQKTTIYELVISRKLDEHLLYAGSPRFQCLVQVHYEVSPSGSVRQLKNVFRSDCKLTRENLMKQDDFVVVSLAVVMIFKFVLSLYSI